MTLSPRIRNRFERPDAETARVAAFVAAALAIRVTYAYFTDLPPWNDAAEWDQARLYILHGQPYTAPWTPLYPALLALASKIFGGGYFLLNCVNSLLSALTCLFTYLAAREVFGKKTAVLALAASVFYVDTVWYSSVLLAENLGVFMLAFLTWRFVRDGSAAVDGFVFGLTCLTKGLFLVLLPGLLAWIYLRHRETGWRRRAAVFTGAALLTLLPWSVRNVMVYKAPVLLEPHWASAVFVGHNPYATGGCDYDFLDHDYGKFYTDPSLSLVEKNRVFLRKSWEFVRDNPLSEFRLTLLRASKHLTFATSFVLYRAPYPARKFMFGLSLLQHMVLFPLCALGMAFAFRDRGAFGFSMIVAILAGVFITLFSANTRMRLPLVPAMITLAAHGAMLLPGLFARLRAGDTAGIRGKLAASAAAIAFLYLNFFYQVLTRARDVAGRFG
ncbi:MAG: glycosyltransferase family 39 protein [Elusimicrobiota bacterium]|nr:glycosyltransferase family 39 protein [Elusimicrobiota bacterium]